MGRGRGAGPLGIMMAFYLDQTALLVVFEAVQERRAGEEGLLCCSSDKVRLYSSVTARDVERWSRVSLYCEVNGLDSLEDEISSHTLGFSEFLENAYFRRVSSFVDP
jgi:hypothetical protein